jgi:hypothetical protein
LAHAASGGDGRTIVVVVPITHTAPRRSTDALEIPAETKRRLGLDDDRSWVVLTETNVFPWPGPDVRAVSRHADASIAYGLLPAAFFRVLRDRLVANQAVGILRPVPRTE